MCPRLEVTVRAAAESIQTVSSLAEEEKAYSSVENSISINTANATISETITFTRKVGF